MWPRITINSGLPDGHHNRDESKEQQQTPPVGGSQWHLNLNVDTDDVDMTPDATPSAHNPLLDGMIEKFLVVNKPSGIPSVSVGGSAPTEAPAPSQRRNSATKRRRTPAKKRKRSTRTTRGPTARTANKQKRVPTAAGGLVGPGPLKRNKWTRPKLDNLAVRIQTKINTTCRELQTRSRLARFLPQIKSLRMLKTHLETHTITTGLPPNAVAADNATAMKTHPHIESTRYHVMCDRYPTHKQLHKTIASDINNSFNNRSGATMFAVGGGVYIGPGTPLTTGGLDTSGGGAEPSAAPARTRRKKDTTEPSDARGETLMEFEWARVQTKTLPASYHAAILKSMKKGWFPFPTDDRALLTSICDMAEYAYRVAMMCYCETDPRYPDVSTFPCSAHEPRYREFGMGRYNQPVYKSLISDLRAYVNETPVDNPSRLRNIIGNLFFLTKSGEDDDTFLTPFPVSHCPDMPDGYEAWLHEREEAERADVASSVARKRRRRTKTKAKAKAKFNPTKSMAKFTRSRRRHCKIAKSRRKLGMASTGTGSKNDEDKLPPLTPMELAHARKLRFAESQYVNATLDATFGDRIRPACDPGMQPDEAPPGFFLSFAGPSKKDLHHAHPGAINALQFKSIWAWILACRTAKNVLNGTPDNLTVRSIKDFVSAARSRGSNSKHPQGSGKKAKIVRNAIPWIARQMLEALFRRFLVLPVDLVMMFIKQTANIRAILLSKIARVIPAKRIPPKDLEHERQTGRLPKHCPYYPVPVYRVKREYRVRFAGSEKRANAILHERARIMNANAESGAFFTFEELWFILRLMAWYLGETNRASCIGAKQFHAGTRMVMKALNKRDTTRQVDLDQPAPAAACSRYSFEIDLKAVVSNGKTYSLVDTIVGTSKRDQEARLEKAKIRTMLCGSVVCNRVHDYIHRLCDAFDNREIDSTQFIAGCNLYNVLTAYHGGPPFFYVLTGDPLAGTTVSICVTNSTLTMVGNIPDAKQCGAFVRRIMRVAANGGLLFDIKPMKHDIPRLRVIKASYESGERLQILNDEEHRILPEIEYRRPSNEMMEWWRGIVRRERTTDKPVTPEEMERMRQYMRSRRVAKNAYLRTVPVRISASSEGNGVGNMAQGLWELAEKSVSMRYKVMIRRVVRQFNGIFHLHMQYNDPETVLSLMGDKEVMGTDTPINFSYMVVFSEHGMLIVSGALSNEEIQAAVLHMYALLTPFLTSIVPLPTEIKPKFISLDDVYAYMVGESADGVYPFLQTPFCRMMLHIRDKYIENFECPAEVYEACKDESFCLEPPAAQPPISVVEVDDRR